VQSCIFKNFIYDKLKLSFVSDFLLSRLSVVLLFLISQFVKEIIVKFWAVVRSAKQRWCENWQKFFFKKLKKNKIKNITEWVVNSLSQTGK